MKELEIDTLIRVDMPSSEVTVEGQRLINQLLMREYGITLEKYQWDWTWYIPRGEFAGTLPKRVGRWLYKVHSKQAGAKFLEEVGNIGMRNTIKAEEVWIDFTRNFDWDKYDFGQVDGSCYFGGSYGHALTVLKDTESLAIRFFQPDTSVTRDGKGPMKYKGYRGFGRSWLVKQPTREDFKYFALFNAYGISLSAAAYTLAQYVGEGLTYKQVSLRNIGRDANSMYVNGNRGMVVGTPELLEPMANVDMHLAQKDRYTYHCGRCQKGLTRRDQLTQVGVDMWCGECVEGYARWCDGTEQLFPAEAGRPVGPGWYSGIYLQAHPTVRCETCGYEAFVLVVRKDKYYCSVHARALERQDADREKAKAKEVKPKDAEN